MKRVIAFLLVLSSIIGLSAQAQKFLGLRSDRITTEATERIERQNRQVSTPSFTPIEGYYDAPVDVSIHAVPADATIYYTTDGSIPDETSSVYSTPITVNEHTVIKAFAVKDGYPDSDVGSAEYFFRVANPTFSVLSGSFATPQHLTLSVDIPGANIRYTTDGSNPSENVGQIYSGTPILINNTTQATVVKAIAYLDGWITSAIVTHTYVINPPVAGPFFSVASGNYYNTFSVSISAVPAVATIYYTTNGSEPSPTNGTLYTIPILINRNTTLKARAYLVNYPPSAVQTAIYNLHNSPVSFSPAQGTYYTAQTVTLSTPTPAAAIWYTLDGTSPTVGSSLLYNPSNPIVINQTTTITALAQRINWHNSPVTSATYTIDIPIPDVAALSIQPASGLYTSAIDVLISTPTPGATIRYTTDNSEPTLIDGFTYTAPFEVSTNTTVKARAFKAGHNPSEIAVAQYFIVIPVQTVDSPTFTPPAGVYNEPKLVSIATATDGASIRYTTDGSDPSETHGTLYTDHINVDESVNIKAIAYKAGMNPSQVISSAYVINIIVPTVSAVSFSLPSGTYYVPQSLTLSTTTTGASIRYTTDGSDPTPTSGTVYTQAIPIPSNSSLFIKAIAYLDGYNPSAVASAYYLVTGTVAEVIFSLPAGTYQTPQSLSLETATQDASIYYTTDGSNPTRDSYRYLQPIALPLNSTTTIKARAFKTDWLPSDIETNTYIITGSVVIHDPVFTPAAGTYTTPQQVTVNTPYPADATIYYTTDGSDPTQSSVQYTQAINLPLNTSFTLKVRAYKTDWEPSPVYTAIYNMTGQVELPLALFTPAPGTYQSAQTVSLAPATLPADATLRYALDGSEPSLSSAAYISPITISAGQVTTLKVKGFKDGWIPSETITGIYNITGQLSFITPVFDPSPGIYTTAQSVTVNSTIQPGTTIRYTTNGTEPTESSPIYSAPIPVPLNTTMTIKVKAFKPDWTPSVTYTAQYTVTGQLTIASPVFTPAAGIYTTAQNVVINTTQPAGVGAVVRYTLDGTDPTTASPVYTGPISVSSSTQIKVRAFATNWLPSEVYLANYTITGQVEIPEAVFTPPSGTYSTVQMLTINTPVPAGATVRYTLDGSDPTQSSQIYNRPILLQLDRDIQVKAKAFLTDWTPSPTYTANYHMTGQAALTDPVFDPPPGPYTTAQMVEIVSNTIPAGGTIRYTTDGSDPDESSPIYSSPIEVALNSSLTLKARAYVTDWDAGEIVTGIYQVTGQVQLPAVMFTPAPGTYQSAQTVSLAPATLPADATLRYTLDGSEPTESSPAYQAPISLPLNSSTTIKVKGFMKGWVSSEISSAVYTITGTLPSPVFSLPGGLYAQPPAVSITCEIPGATIHYTTDGSIPTQDSPILAEGETVEIPHFTIDKVITAKAFKPDWIESAASSETYSVLEIPIDLRAFTHGGYIRVLWNFATPIRGLQGFNIDRRALSESSFTRLNSSLIPLSQKIGEDWYFDDYDIQINRSYEYRVTAVYDDVESLPSSSTVVVYLSHALEISSASHAYPNPATDATRFRLVLTRNDNVTATIIIYDFAGKKIKTLTVPTTTSNLIEVPWDLTNSDNQKVGRGTYFARVTASDSVTKTEYVIKISVK